MNKSNEINELAAALSAFQGEVTNPPYSKTVNIPNRPGYRYAELSSIFDHIRPLMMKHGLSVSQPVGNDGGNVVVNTILFHKSGQSIAAAIPLPVGANSKMQEIGSAISYAKRYGLCAILGINGDVDDDAINADGKDGHSIQDRQPAKSQQTRRFSGPPPARQEPPVVDGDWLPASTHQEFSNRFSACFKGASAQDRRDYLAGLGSHYGFSFQKDKDQPFYESVDLRVLNQALCDAEAGVVASN